MSDSVASRARLSSNTLFWVTALAVLLVAAWFVLRYGGRWGDNDTFNFTRTTQAVLETATFLNPVAYPNGYGFQSLAAILMQASGLSMPGMQMLAAGLLATWLIFPAWLLYRELTGSTGGAALALAFLFVQPEFLFAVLRGSHEKFTRGLMLLCLFLIVRGLNARRRPTLFSGFLLAFYLAAFGLIAFNIFQATSFILTLGTALLIIWAIIHLQPAPFPAIGDALRRLGFAIITLLILAFLFIFYVYPPAQHTLFVLESVSDRLARLFLDVENTLTGEAYEYVNWGWVSLPVYFLVTLANWLLLLASAGIWCWWTWRWIRTGQAPRQLSELLLWSFFGAFAFLGFVSILVDLSGSVIGNLQHRVFPSFVMLAAPLVAWWLVEHPPGRLRLRQGLYAGTALLMGLLALLSTFKATNEPLVSNRWTFYLPAERQAVRWSDEKLVEERLLWISFDDRLYSALGAHGNGSLPERIFLDTYEVEPSTRDFLISELIRVRSLRLGVPLPVEADSLITYDNGHAQIYHLRPRTPFQK